MYRTLTTNTTEIFRFVFGSIGFDIRGDVKVFDFGLCKSLSPRLKARNGGYGYRLTGRAGEYE